ncbi:MAG: Flavin-dependent oxidoreductase, luciferase family [Nocardioides sp.]|nr:Flavin-dependent oxidoreductase, luciferase family [Nocardioides sp.]
MEFGLMFSFIVNGEQTNLDAYREMDTLLPLAEELGFTSFHTTEHHFQSNGWAPSPLMVLAKAAGLTSTMRLATNILLVPLYHPLRLAEDLAVLDNLSEGRISVGIAPGYASEEFHAFAIPMAERVGRFEEAIDILQLAWKGEPFTWEGKYFSIPWAHLVPAPVQETLPIWYGVSGPRLLERAAERRVPVTASPRHTISELKAHFDRYGAVAAETGYVPDERPVIREVFIAPTQEEAEAIAGPAITEMFSLYGLKSAQGERALTNDAGELVTHEGQVDFRTFSSRYVVGDPESAIDQIQHLRDEIDPTVLVCRMQLPGVSTEHFERSLRMFATEVMPAFADS